MKKLFKLALLFGLVLVSIIPMVYFFVNDWSHGARSYFLQLFTGQATLEINIPHNDLRIFSHIFLGIYETQLSYIVLVVGSSIVFWISLILIAIVEEPILTRMIIRLKSTLNLNSHS